MDSKLESSGSSKHKRTHPEVVAGSGSSKPSISDSEVVVESGSNWHSAIHPVVIDSSGSSKHSASDPDCTIDEGHRPATSENLASSSAASSSSSDSSLEDFFQVDTKIKSRAGPTAPPKADDVQLARKDDENDVTSNGSPVPPSSSSQVSDLTRESILLSMSPAQSPPAVQEMERSGDYDPYRIPASVFASKPSTPMEWSVASNESLFSIHVGNNSFSRDHFIMLGGDLHKSGELTKSGELIVYSPTPPVKIVEIDRKSIDKGKNFDPSGETDVLIMDGHKKKADDQSKEMIVHRAVSLLSSSNSKQSDGSGYSTRSFEFPILADGMKSGSLKVESGQHTHQRQQKSVSKCCSCNWLSCFSCCPNWFSCYTCCPRTRCSCCC